MADFLAHVLGTRAGKLAVAFGRRPYFDDKGKYRFRDWHDKTLFDWPDELPTFLAAVRQEMSSGDPVDIYACPAIRQPTEKTRRKGGALPPMVCWTDLDGAPKDQALYDTLNGLVVWSGQDGHQHLYVPLSRPVGIAQHRTLQEALRDRLGGDDKIADNDVLRWPGSLNHKPATAPNTGEPAPVTLAPGEPAVWDPAELAAMLGVDLEHAKTSSTASNGTSGAEPVDLDKLPAWLRKRLADVNPDDRSDAFHGLVGACKDAGLTQGQAVTVMGTWRPGVDKYGDRLGDEVARCWPKLAKKVSTIGTKKVSADTSADQFDGAGEGLSDGMLCATVARDVLAGRYRWCKGMGWLTWTGKRWKPTPDQAVMEEVRRYLLAQWRDALRQLGQAKTDEQRKALEVLVAAWRATLNKGRIGAITALAQGIDGVLTEVDALDAHPDLLNAGNGVIDLRTGTLADHDPALLLTKITEVDYRPDAQHPDWTAALEAVPADRRSWLQQRLGQGITGYMTPDDVMIVIDGGGENGKTTVAVGIRGALGDYYTQISHRALLGDPSQHPTELMSFRGARVAFLEELPEERRLSVTRLKSLVGTPTMKARLIRQDEIEFESTHSLFLNTNHLPVVDETDHGTWRRLARLRFPYTFRKNIEDVTDSNDRLGDPNLRQRLQEGRDKQHEAVLAWLVSGAVGWYKNNRVMPTAPISVVSDTKAWRGKSDLLLAYAADRLIFEVDAHVLSSDLLADFNEWLKAHGHREWSDRTLAGRLEEHSEFSSRQVEKKVIRRNDKLSRRPADVWATPKDPPGMYRAWLGLRFRQPHDEWPEPEATP